VNLRAYKSREFPKDSYLLQSTLTRGSTYVGVVDTAFITGGGGGGGLKKSYWFAD
jgi:hypothetical protein